MADYPRFVRDLAPSGRVLVADAAGRWPRYHGHPDGLRAQERWLDRERRVAEDEREEARKRRQKSR